MSLVQAPEVPAMRSLAELLTAAAALERPEYRGMLISLLGVISHASRALKGMAQMPEDVGAQGEHEERLMEFQPRLHAEALDQLYRHIELAIAAAQKGDAQVIRQLFEVYRP